MHANIKRGAYHDLSESTSLVRSQVQHVPDGDLASGHSATDHKAHATHFEHTYQDK